MDDFSTGDKVMVAHARTNAKVRIFNALLGDVLAWICVAGFAATIAVFLLQLVR